MLRYRCLILDHDDTTVDSTRPVNYPQFQQALAHLRPDMKISEEEYIRYCFQMGFYVMCDKVLHYTDEEMKQHLTMWKEYHRTHPPGFFDGIPSLMNRYRSEGGLVCVVSHSSSDVIEASYHNANVPAPDLIFGAEQPPEHMKPNPWPLQEIMRRFSLTPEDCLVVDDMPHGGTMAEAAGVPFACAGWYGMPAEMEIEMKHRYPLYFSSVETFTNYIFV